MNQDPEECLCQRCQISAKFRSITAKLRNKADREWMEGFHDQLVGYVAHMEGIVDAVMSEDEPRPVKQLPRKDGQVRKRR